MHSEQPLACLCDKMHASTDSQSSVMFALLALLPSHVPTYGGDVENCFKLPHIHTVSQVVYIHGSGGLEIHVEDDTTPFDTQGGELIDFDAVFREEIDQSTYSLYVGCGGCVLTKGWRCKKLVYVCVRS